MLLQVRPRQRVSLAELRAHHRGGKRADEDAALWHKDEFKGQFMPFRANVFFKPSGARCVEQNSKMHPAAIPGIFAGYEVATGQGLSSKKLAWALEERRSDADRPIITKRINM